ncbi:uncharacterized protein LOC113510057 [Galleria mellonella]|uniref:Uncharacterized protein LOC113510057 n=1 Tax=Galleria mellonella TaxID=7137 RepID=A0A6J3C6C4_GALME|nr:uncharacterized protein LOC113510057 [Galleria mellonella]
MRPIFLLALLLSSTTFSNSDPSASFNFNYPNIKDDIYDQPVNMMVTEKSPHNKNAVPETGLRAEVAWSPYDMTKLEAYLDAHREDDADHNRIRRSPKRRRGHSRRRSKLRASSPSSDDEVKNASTTETPSLRSNNWETQQAKKKKKKHKKDKPKYDTYDPPVKEWESGFVEMPKDLYQAHLRPGVIFRIHMSEAILKMQYRNYGEDKDESVIEADVEYLRLTRKVINDEITKFEDLKWLIGWFNNRSELIQEHICNTRYYTVGTPPTMFTHPEEYMKRMCLFDNVYIDHIPYVVGEDSSLMAAVAPPVLHCDAATCTSVPFIDSVMFDERLARTNVRKVTRCQASCRAHCRNDVDCLKRCSDRCLRAE